MASNRDLLIQYALSFPGAWADHPWGEVVAKVGKKVFVFFGTGTDASFGMSVKLPTSGGMVLMAPFAEPTGYGLGKAGWVSLRFEAEDDTPAPAMLAAWIEESYRAVANKTQVKALDAAPVALPGGASTKKASTKKASAKKASSKKASSKKASSKKASTKRSAAKRASKKSPSPKSTARRSAR